MPDRPGGSSALPTRYHIICEATGARRDSRVTTVRPFGNFASTAPNTGASGVAAAGAGAWARTSRPAMAAAMALAATFIAARRGSGGAVVMRGKMAPRGSARNHLAKP